MKHHKLEKSPDMGLFSWEKEVLNKPGKDHFSKNNYKVIIITK